jgi:hypothetical protein
LKGGQVPSLNGPKLKKTSIAVDPLLWTAFRVRALQGGKSATTVLNKLIFDYAFKREPGHEPMSFPAQLPRKRKERKKK